MICIHGGLLHDAIHEQPYVADIYVENGKILKVETASSIPEGCEVIDASGKEIYPGFVEAHGHIGLDGYAMGYEGMDYNEMNDPVAPQLRAIDGINPMDEAWAYAAAAGVTCVATGPGSANVLGGTFAAVKTRGVILDDMLVKAEVAMKCAFGENPKRCYQSKSISTRMSTAGKLREMLFLTREYDQKKKAAGEDESKLPAFNMKYESLLPVLHGEMPLKAHAHQLNDIMTAIRIAGEFGVKLTLEHVTEGHLAPEAIAASGCMAAVGPSLTNASKIELRNKSWTTPGILDRAGVHVSIITDSPVIPQQYLPLCAGLAVQAGMDPFHALQAITIHPAEHIGIADRVGSIEAGKDADLVMTDGCPFEVGTEVLQVWINGKTVK